MPIELVTVTIIPGEVTWIMSGLNFVTAEYILGLNANESGTFWYRGHGKLKRRSKATEMQAR
jgi:hypothetical protein